MGSIDDAAITAYFPARKEWDEGGKNSARQALLREMTAQHFSGKLQFARLTHQLHLKKCKFCRDTLDCTYTMIQCLKTITVLVARTNDKLRNKESTYKF